MAVRKSGGYYIKYLILVLPVIQALILVALLVFQPDAWPVLRAKPAIDATKPGAVPIVDQIGSRLNPRLRVAAMPHGKIGGIAFTDWDPEHYSPSLSDVSLPRLKATGARWVGEVVVVHQESANSTTIYPGYFTLKDAGLIYEIQKARELGMKVLLKPQVWVDTAEFIGASQIGTGITAESQWDAWFVSYTATIVKYAQIAQENGVEMFCVGTELAGTTSQSARWRDVIKAVRQVYGGMLTYTAISGEEISIDWWDELDIIGVSAYYPLTGKNDPTVEQLKGAWTPWARRLAELAGQTGKPVLFTEVGYRSVAGANIAPWDLDPNNAIDMDEQANCYRAVFETFWNRPWFAGMFWWEWDKNPASGGPSDNWFTPHDKPAEAVLRTWFGGPADPAAPTDTR
jgi:hypothetical protein